MYKTFPHLWNNNHYYRKLYSLFPEKIEQNTSTGVTDRPTVLYKTCFGFSSVAYTKHSDIEKLHYPKQCTDNTRNLFKQVIYLLL